MDPLQSAQIADTVNQEPPAIPQPPMVSQPVNPLELPKQKNSSIIFILSLTTIVACLIAAFFYWQNTKLIKEAIKIETTPTPTATPDITINWKTYTNATIGFSLRYPIQWTQNSLLNTPGQKIKELLNLKTDLVAEGISIEAVQNPLIDFRVLYFDYITDLNSWVEEIKAGGENLVKIASTKIINGNNFYEVSGLGSLGGCTKDYFIKAKKGFLNFKLEPYSANCTNGNPNIQIDEKLNQILSTFQFLEVTPSASPSSTPSSFQ